jgi:glycine cleavage system H protein
MDGPECRIGLTYFAQAHLGEIVYVDLLKEGTLISADQSMAGIESAKTTSEIIAPVSGRVLASNRELVLLPTLINDSPMERGWIVRIEPTSPHEFDLLMDLEAYEAYLGSLPAKNEDGLDE